MKTTIDYPQPPRSRRIPSWEYEAGLVPGEHADKMRLRRCRKK